MRVDQRAARSNLAAHNLLLPGTSRHELSTKIGSVTDTLGACVIFCHPLPDKVPPDVKLQAQPTAQRGLSERHAHDSVSGSLGKTVQR